MQTLTPSDLITPNWPAPLNVKAIQTTRLGGVSSAPYTSLNLSDQLQDDGLKVAQNRQQLNYYVPTEPVWLKQVHGIRVINASNSLCLEEADASYSRDKQVVCVTMTADCLPLLLCDRAGTVVAAVHAGWRSLCAGVIEATVKSMQTIPGEILAWLGPAIGSTAFEVGEDVRAAFMDQDSKAEVAFVKHKDKWLCDLYQLAKQRLSNVGVDKIYGATVNEVFCTYHDHDRFFSYRRDKETGRMASLIWIEH